MKQRLFIISALILCLCLFSAMLTKSFQLQKINDFQLKVSRLTKKTCPDFRNPEGRSSIDTKWEIREHLGALTLVKEGIPVTPMIFWQSQPEEFEVKRFSNVGLDLFSFFRSQQHYNQPYWKPDGRISLEFQDSMINKLLSYNSKAYILPRLFTTAPEWWVQSNPGELCKYASGKITTSRESMASQKYKDEAGFAYRQAVQHMITSDYGKQMLGVHVTGGPWGEHFYWDAYFQNSDRPAGSDTSEPMRLALVNYLKNKYGKNVKRLQDAWKDKTLTFENVQVPGIEQRIQTNAGAWRDPQKSRAVMDYFECHNEVVVKMIDHFCRIVKEESADSLLTMIFYGYTQDENWPIESDHRAISKLLQLESVDMLSSPHTYYRRALGEDGEMRQYLASTSLHGKLFFDEADDQTYLEKLKENPDRRCYANNVAESQALLYREFGNTVTHGVGLWYMDLNGGWFRDTVLVGTVGHIKKWADTSLYHSRKRNAQIALISAPESEFYMGYRQTPDNEISFGLYHNQVGEFYHAGAPFDWYLIDDLEAIKDLDYKVYIFLDCFYMTDQQRKVVESLRSKNHTVLWFYAPGYASQENLSLQRMEHLTGFKFNKEELGILKGSLVDSGGEVGIDKTQKTLFTVIQDKGVQPLAYGVDRLKDKIVFARKTNPDWTSVFSAIPGVTNDMLRNLYKEAGVHIYSDCGDVISANESWLMIHTRTAGIKNIHLPKYYRKVTEITEEKLIGENINSFTIELPQYSTAVFFME
jgi:hypothetical protein